MSTPSSLARFSLEGKTAIVTGGSQGIGRAIALAFAEAGANVVPVARSAEKVAATAAEIEALGRRSLRHPTDVSREAEVKALAAKVLAEFGGVDILVNCAGITMENRRFVDLTEADWDRIIGVNLKGTFFCSREFGRAMVEKKSGAILNFSSILATVGVATTLPYSATKGGVEAMTRTLAVEWARKNVRVNCLVPGFLETDMTSELRGKPDESSWLKKQIPQGRFGTAEEMVGLSLVLCSGAGSYVTGAIMYADGGWSVA